MKIFFENLKERRKWPNSLSLTSTCFTVPSPYAPLRKILTSAEVTATLASSTGVSIVMAVGLRRPRPTRRSSSARIRPSSSWRWHSPTTRGGVLSTTGTRSHCPTRRTARSGRSTSQECPTTSPYGMLRTSSPRLSRASFPLVVTTASRPTLRWSSLLGLARLPRSSASVVSILASTFLVTRSSCAS